MATAIFISVLCSPMQHKKEKLRERHIVFIRLMNMNRNVFMKTGSMVNAECDFIYE